MCVNKDVGTHTSSPDFIDKNKEACLWFTHLISLEHTFDEFQA